MDEMSLRNWIAMRCKFDDLAVIADSDAPTVRRFIGFLRGAAPGPIGIVDRDST